jgi:type III pantothenate kinase
LSYILLDAGNSYLKLGMVEKEAEQVNEFYRFSYDNLEDELTRLLQDQLISAAVISNVNNYLISHTICDVIHHLWRIEPYQLIVEQGEYGLITRYENPRMLGSDRWAALISAKKEFSSNLCVIDCGSAITVDVVTDKGIHLGGLITPGLSMSRKALGLSTSHLPLVDHEIKPNSSFLAINTRDAIMGGTLYQISAYIERIVTEIKNEFDDNVECVITGGDAVLIQSLSLHQFHHRQTLVLDGLRIVAQHLYN